MLTLTCANRSNEQKYISLFPPTPDAPTDPAASSEPEGKLALPPLLHPATEPTDKGEKRQLEILRSIQAMMERGEVSRTPEDESKGKKVDVLVSTQEGKVSSKKAEAKEEADDFFEDDEE